MIFINLISFQQSPNIIIPAKVPENQMINTVKPNQPKNDFALPIKDASKEV